jgi:FAD/FMN-containing dehydrogenase
VSVLQQRRGDKSESAASGGEILEGWGMRNRARCHVVRPQDVHALPGIFADVAARGGTLGLRGSGCSYGDAALNSDQTVLDCTALNRVRSWNPDTGQITVEPGVTIAQLWQRTLPDGWWPSVVPGTSAVTIGGGAAMNVHGKNNWRVGTFGDYVLAFDLLLPSGTVLPCSRSLHADLFHAAIGGLGLLGCFTSLTLQTHRVSSGLVREVQAAHPSLATLLEALEAATAWASDLVAWIDTSAQGRSLGRGLLKAGHDLAPGEDPAPARSLSIAGQLPRSRLVHRLPEGLIPRLARPLTTPIGVWAANRGQWLRGQAPGAGRPHLTSYVQANFPLDAIPSWKESYRPGGLIQHQSFVPRAAADRTFRALLTRSHASGLIPAFAVLKKHRPDDFLLSYLGDGYSLALDYPVRRGEEQRLLTLMDEMNTLVADAGGRCYFAKDSTLTPAQARRMLPAENLARFLVLKSTYDPRTLLSTDLYRRLLAVG